MRRLIVDTNLLVLLIVGSVQRSSISQHSRTSRYTPEDFDLLKSQIGSEKILVLPNIASEVSNLLSSRKSHNANRYADITAQLIRSADEVYVSSTVAISHPAYRRLGVTDVAILEVLAGENGIRLLTDDLDLYLSACAAKFDAHNFSHLREAFNTV